MNRRYTKRKLAIELSRLEDVENPKLELEQYTTDSELASELLWNAYMLGDVENKVVADLGAGNGILGIGALIMGAKKVYFVELDSDAVKVLKRNLSKYNFTNYEIMNIDVGDFRTRVDVVIMNPPFGIQSKQDVKFFETAKRSASTIYMIYPNVERVRNILKDYNVTVLSETAIKIRKRFFFHEKEKEFFRVYIIRAIRV